MVKPRKFIYIYSDIGASELSVDSVIKSFANKLSTKFEYHIKRISSAQILAGELQGQGLFVMPGGADLPYCQQLNGRGNKLIREFIEAGNIYIGICAGAYYAAQAIDFVGEGYTVKGQRELGFFSGTAFGSLAYLTASEKCPQGLHYNGLASSKAIASIGYKNGVQEGIYYHGGPHFVPQPKAQFDAIAVYPEGEYAAVIGEVGKGAYLLSGVHFELCGESYQRHALMLAKTQDSTQEAKLLRTICAPNYATEIYQRINQLLERCFVYS